MQNEVPVILKNLKNNNSNHDIKIRYRKNPSNNYRLYLDYWDGSKRYTDNLKIYIAGTKNEIVRDKNIVRLAIAIRDEKEIELLKERTGFALKKSKQKVNFFDFFKTHCNKKTHANYRVSYYHFKDFYNKGFLDINQINFELCEKYKNYLLTLNITRHTAQDYFAAFKTTLNYAVKLRIIDYNPARDLSIKYDKKSRERLTYIELQKLKKTECKYSSLKNGFLFSCYTGLRISDIRNLEFSNIIDDHVSIIQQKTRSQVNIKLNKTANEILKEQKKKKINNCVFHIPHGGKTSKRLKDWLIKAGIKKKITFHSARFTFGCLLIENGAPLFAVKKLMGHKNFK